MPSKKKKYNARFPAGRIKKIMQTDEEVGKVAQAVPVIISRTLELFVESLLSKTMQITMAKSAKTLSTSHMKQCILSESRFDFLKDLVKSLPDSSTCDDDNVSVSSAGLSPGAATPTMGITGPLTPMLSSDLMTTSPTLPLQTPFPPHCSLPSREPLIDSDNMTRVYPAATSIADVCQQNSSSAGAILPPRMNPNFYTESPSFRMNHNRGNHFNSNPSAAVSNERPSSPPLLVVDEDYDT